MNKENKKEIGEKCWGENCDIMILGHTGLFCKSCIEKRERERGKGEKKDSSLSTVAKAAKICTGGLTNQ